MNLNKVSISINTSISEEENGILRRTTIIFGLIYFTFFLDNVLLTVLVPIIPDWVRGDALQLWAHNSPVVSLAALLNHTHHGVAKISGNTTKIVPSSPSNAEEQIIVGFVLGVKALTQLLMAPVASAAVSRFGPCIVLRISTATLAASALMFGLSACWNGHSSVWCIGVGRAAHGAGSALAGVSGLALAAAALPETQRNKALGVLLGAVALGVLVGYPFGGAAYAIWNREAPFLIVAVALFANLALQSYYLNNNEYTKTPTSDNKLDWYGEMMSVIHVSRGVSGKCAGAVLLTTSVMASLEPCLPLWLMERFHPQKWQLGAVFIPDSAGYLIAASLLGGWSKVLGAERVALAGVLAVGFSALIVPLARSVSALAWPHAILGIGLGGTDAALVPALLARQPHKVHHLAALIQAASSAAYAIGPVGGGLISAWLGFPTTMRILGVANIMYAGILYKALRENPLSEQWGAKDGDGISVSSNESTILQPRQYKALQHTAME